MLHGCLYLLCVPLFHLSVLFIKAWIQSLSEPQSKWPKTLAAELTRSSGSLQEQTKQRRRDYREKRKRHSPNSRLTTNLKMRPC